MRGYWGFQKLDMYVRSRESIPALQSIDALQSALRERLYFADRNLSAAIYLAVSLERPLFLEGEVGVGKTEAAKVLAKVLDTRFIRLQCYEGIDVHQALYEWDFTRQMLYIRLLENNKSQDQVPRRIFGEEFLVKGPLLRALEKGGPMPPVLLIDELDRADDEFEALLLEILSDFQVTIPEVGTVQAEQPPIVVITSNRTREIHDALKRRCLYHWIDYPSPEWEYQIVMAKVPSASAELTRQICQFVQDLRTSDLYKIPGVSETLEWAQALVYLGYDEVTADALSDTLGTLLKYQEDMKWARTQDFSQLLSMVQNG